MHSNSTNTDQGKRYLILTADFPPIEGGISTVTTQLASRLHRRGQLVGVGAPRLHSAGGNDSSDYPYPVFRIPGYHWGALRAIPARGMVSRWVESQRNQFQKIIAMNAGFGGVLALGLASRFDLPFDVIAYGFEFLKFRSNPVGRAILLKVFREAERVLAISDFTRDQLVEFGVPREKIARIQLGVDLDRFQPQPDEAVRLRSQMNSEGKTILLSVGRLVRRKGHAKVLEALSSIQRRYPGVVYWIAGRGPEENRLKAMVARLGLESSVRFLGYVPDCNLPGLYSASDLFVLPTSNEKGSVEGYGLVFLEAAACGLPSLAGKSGGVPEAILDGVSGILIDPVKTSTLAQALTDLLSHPDHLSVLKQDALQHAQTRPLSLIDEIFD